MDPPKTRRETKKTAKEKKAQVYSAKHIRQMELLHQKRTTDNSSRSL
jgi:hypothetical protein